MALSQSAVSELLDVFRAGDGVDLIRESVHTVLQELVEVEASEGHRRRAEPGCLGRTVRPTECVHRQAKFWKRRSLGIPGCSLTDQVRDKLGSNVMQWSPSDGPRKTPVPLGSPDEALGGAFEHHRGGVNGELRNCLGRR